MSLNPAYAQGMTVAALAAGLLQDTLGHRSVEDRQCATRYHRDLARIIRWPWLMARIADQRWLPSPPPLRYRAIHRYLDHALAAGTTDAHVQRVLLELLNIRSTPTALLAPGTALRILSGHSTEHAP